MTPAKKLWDAIVSSAWSTGAPCLIFPYTINAGNPTPLLGNIEATNPCGEVPLLSYESCNLGSINLPKFLKQENGKKSIDWSELERVIRIAARFLDNVIEINNYLFIDQVMKEGTLQHVIYLPADIKNIFKTALEINPEWHLRHQAVFQQYTDNAVSKTINLPAGASKEAVSKIYKMAWQQQLQGITVFRYHSRQRQVLHSGISTKSGVCKVCVE